jgi:hypothetical protein
MIELTACEGIGMTSRYSENFINFLTVMEVAQEGVPHGSDMSEND